MIKFTKIIFLLSLIVFINPAHLLAKYNYYHFKLYNGLEFYLIKTNSPVITYSTWVKAGGIDEKNIQGVAHLLEHMMFKDNKYYNESQLNKMLYNTGGEYNAFTNYDYTVYYETVPFYSLNTVMKVESSRMQGLVFKQKQFEEEKKVVLEERGLRIDNNPLAKFNEQIVYYMLPFNNYGRSLIGSRDMIKNIKIDDVKQFYHTYYRPDNIKIFVIGNVSIKKLKYLARKYYNKEIKPRKKLFRNHQLGLEDYTNNVNIEIQNNKVLQNIYAVSYLAPSINTAKNKNEVYSLYILQNYLNSDLSNIYNILVKKDKLAQDVSASYDINTRLNTNFVIYIVPHNNTKANIVLNKLQFLINNIKKQGVKPEKLQLFIKQMNSERIYLRANERKFLLVYANFIMNGFSTKEFFNIWNNIDHLTPEIVNKNIKKYLSTHKKLTIKLIQKK